MNIREKLINTYMSTSWQAFLTTMLGRQKGRQKNTAVKSITSNIIEVNQTKYLLSKFKFTDWLNQRSYPENIWICIPIIVIVLQAKQSNIIKLLINKVLKIIMNDTTYKQKIITKAIPKELKSFKNKINTHCRTMVSSIIHSR